MRRLFIPAASCVLAVLPITAIRADDMGAMHEAPAEHHQGGGQAMQGDIMVTGGWARPMLPGQPTGGGYFVLMNHGGTPDRLIGASSPAASKVEIHSMTMKGEVMEMRPVEGGLEIPAGGVVMLEPGGLHLMFMQVAEPFKVGASLPLTLRFEKAGTLEMMLPVEMPD